MTMEQSQHPVAWGAGNLYERYMGRWSSGVAREFLLWLAVPAGMDWLDVGCGTGVLTRIILDQASPRSVQGIDPSAGFLAYAQAHTPAGEARFAVGDAQWLPVETASVDAAVAGLALNYVPQPLRAVADMARVTRPGGVIAAYVWDYAGKMQFQRYFWEAAVALDPAAYELDQGRRFPICQPGPLSDVFTQAGLKHVTVQPIEIPTNFSDFDDYWSPFLGGQGPAPTYVMSLDKTRRDALRDRLRLTLPIADNGTIHLTARAWAVRGYKPQHS
jgi:SAM-dependent methyltransferase